jgi:carbon-monoxide dehydrogenase medium subunit
MFRTLPRFEYVSPETVGETLALLNEYGRKAKVLAGGTDLIPEMKWGEYRPDFVIALSRISGLDNIEYDKKNGLKLGAMCKIAQIEKSDVIKENYPLLSQAASVLASMEIRNRGTVGGNLCTAAPSADMPPSLLALGAKAIIASNKGESVLPLEEFFTGPKKTILNQDEMLVRLEVPSMKPHSAGEYIKFGRRRAMEIAMIGVAAFLTVDPEGTQCIDAKLALATAAPTPIRAKEAEKMLTGKKLDPDIIDAAAQMASKEASPRTSWRTTEEYRRDLIPVLVRRAIQTAFKKIGS